MNVIVRCRDEEFEIHLDITGDGGTIGELVASWFHIDIPVVTVDGRTVVSSVSLPEAGLSEGSVLEVADAADPQLRGHIVSLTGSLAGTSHPLTSGTVTIGAAPADVTVPEASGRIRLHTDNAGGISLRNPERVAVLVDGAPPSSVNVELRPGTWLEIAGHVFGVHATASERPMRRGVFNRPPRQVRRQAATVIEPPPAPQEPAKAMRFGWGALIVPVVIGLAMAVLIHPRMAMFAVFSPAMLLANWFEDRRRARKERKETGEAYRDTLDRFAAEVASAYRSDVKTTHATACSPQELQRRVARGDSRLWERRTGHDDFMVIPIGTGCLPWQPEVRGTVTPEVAGIMRPHAELHNIPVSIRLEAGDVTGIAGDRGEVLALARHVLLRAAATHGPADLTISVFTENPQDWDWAKWLPHVLVDSSGRRRIAGTEPEIGPVMSLLSTGDSADQPGPRHLLVVDLPDLVTGSRASIREALRAGKASGVAGLALARRSLDLPSLSTTIVSVEGELARIRFPDGNGAELAAWRIGAGAARTTARALARLTDPEALTAGSGLPTLVHLGSLLGFGENLDASIQANWARRGRGVSCPLGTGEDGPLVVDLIADGPHALLGGTTGAGKSELLRTLVASLASTTSPEWLNFVLIDYKGGSAFDACAALPHTAGLVTDLDDHLARRALTCLEAELRYREHWLRAVGVSDISMFPDTEADPLPRLLVVIDEFAALAKELPDFMEALVGIAQRGRSLGVHLLLATQRPSGVISDSIKANTNLRIALRVQDNADSVDVIGCTDAAALGRNQPGRGLARLGPGDVVPFQTAIVTGRWLGSRTATAEVRPFVFAHEQRPPLQSVEELGDGPTDLEQIVAACQTVALAMKLPPARLPWPEALSASISLEELETGDPESGGTLFALADEPHRQRQVAAGWSPSAGNLLMYGLPGSGTTTALAALAIGLSADNDPDRLHIYVLDFDDQLLRPLQDLPHVGAVVGSDDRERQVRALRRLADELQQRRHAVATGPGAVAGYPTIVTMLDNHGGFGDAFDEPGDMAVRNLFTRLVADGPGVGMYTIMTAKHPGDIPTRLASLVSGKLAFRLADRYDYSGLGMPATEPPAIPGRAFDAGTGREIQVALPHQDGLAAAVGTNKWGAPLVAPWSIDVLPHEVSVAEVIEAGRISPDEWFLPLGIGDTSLTPTGLVLREGDHALITGPARSGKSTALATVARVARAAHPGIRIVALLPRRSPIADCPMVDQFIQSESLGPLEQMSGTQLLLVDDAELVEDDPYLSELIKTRHSEVHVVAAGATDAIRSLYGHWTQDVRRSRIGCALRPNLSTDGDLWQTPLPRRGPERFPIGRGYLLADGQTELVQLGRK
ncbi:MAG: FtsK/SpoIIIE domain-containing protein [Actinomycetota bacterium]|nr:FtsK/SpoIIIE domain-containing protein [Actinomycetota bacterium]